MYQPKLSKAKFIHAVFQFEFDMIRSAQGRFHLMNHMILLSAASSL